MRTLPLSKGKVTKVDEEDYEYFSQWKWSITKDGYACRSTSIKLGKRKQLKLHREILKAPKNKLVDHINGDKLDNRKSNLRLCTFGQNVMNSKKPKNGVSSKYKGVCYNYKTGKKFRAFIKQNGVQDYLGTFETEVEAAKAYNREALKRFGQFARLNKL